MDVEINIKPKEADLIAQEKEFTASQREQTVYLTSIELEKAT